MKALLLRPPFYLELSGKNDVGDDIIKRHYCTIRSVATIVFWEVTHTEKRRERERTRDKEIGASSLAEIRNEMVSILFFFFLFLCGLTAVGC